MSKLPISPKKSTKAQRAPVKHTRNTIDWSRMSHEFITAAPAVTLTQLALSYGTAREVVSRQATKEQWDIKRERFLARVDEQTTEKKSELVASEGASFDTTLLEYAHKILTLVDDELKGQITLDREGKQVVLQRAAKDIAQAVRIAQDVGKVALGDKPPEGNLKVDLSKASMSDLASALGLVAKVTGKS